MTAVKFCGLCRAEDAAAAAAAGARYVGVILSPVGRRARTPSEAAVIYGAADGVERVGVFVDAAADHVRALAEGLGLGVVQLHGSESRPTVESLRRSGGLRIWKAIRPRDGAEFLAGLDAWAGLAHGLLVDGWSAAGTGGTGERFPWSAVEAHRDRVPSGLSLIVAGGLGPDNVGEAIGRLRPDVVDVSSGVEAEVGVKSALLMRRFVAAARGADAAIGGC